MIEFTTELTPKTLRKMRLLVLKRLYISLALTALAFVLLGVSGILLSDDIFLGTVLIVAGVVVPSAALIALTIKQHKIDKDNAPPSGASVQHVTFDETIFTINTHTKSDEFTANIHNCNTLHYTVIARVKERKKYYLVYLTDSQCLVLFKKNLTHGSLEDLNEIFQRVARTPFRPRRSR